MTWLFWNDFFTGRDWLPHLICNFRREGLKMVMHTEYLERECLKKQFLKRKKLCIQNEWNDMAQWSTFQNQYIHCPYLVPKIFVGCLLWARENLCLYKWNVQVKSLKWQSNILSRKAAGDNLLSWVRLLKKKVLDKFAVNVMEGDNIMIKGKIFLEPPGWLVWAAAWRLPDVRWLLCTSPDTSVALSSSSSSSSFPFSSSSPPLPLPLPPPSPCSPVLSLLSSHGWICADASKFDSCGKSSSHWLLAA